MSLARAENQGALVEDWQVRDAAGKVYGGFTQRAMFAIADRDSVKLPRSLLQIRKEYEPDT